MRIMQRILLVVVTLAGCVAPNTDPRYAQAGSGSNDREEVVCHEVTDTGSLFSHQECVTRRTEQERRDDARNWMDKPRSQTSKY